LYIKELSLILIYETTETDYISRHNLYFAIKKDKRTFFRPINELIDLDDIEELIDADYSRGKNAVGKPSYSDLLVFRMCFLKSWYGLSDYKVENRLNNSISFSYFVE
jgi:IS5 family transposase